MSANLSSPAWGPAAASRYDAIARALHWSMALLILVAFVLGLSAEELPSGLKPGAEKVHVLVGASLVVLLGFRVLWRLTHAAPAAADIGATLERVGRLGHLALYLLMAGTLATGLATQFLRGRGIDLGFVEVPSPFAANRALAKPVKEVHELASFALIGLSGLHVVAALWHQFVLRDHTLEKMSGRP